MEVGRLRTEKLVEYRSKMPEHGSSDGSSTISTKLVEWPVVDRMPRRSLVLYTGHSYAG